MRILLIVFSVIAIAAVIFLSAFFFGITQSPELKNQIDTWAKFGDFMGGTLNPILAALSLFGLLFTIYYQNKELEETRKELKASTIAQQEQSISLKLQNEATKLQMFENTFFQLLNQHNEYLDLLIEEKIELDYFLYSKDNYGFQIKNGLKTMDKIFLDFKEINQTKKSLKNYFMTLFQILKYIDEYAKRNDIDAKFYTNIIRALIDDEILRLLAINCVAYPEFIEYKKYIEEYAFFEHIYLDESKKETKTILEILDEYELGAFDKNKGLITLLNKES